METKTLDSVPLTQNDFIPFHGQEAVIRLYKKQVWIAGFCWKINFSEKICSLWLDPYVSFGLGHEAIPSYPDECLFDIKDWVIHDSLRAGEPRPFKLSNCMKIVTKNPDPELILCSFDDGTMIMSQRLKDLRLAHDCFKIHPSSKFELVKSNP